ncbi:MAG: lipopolysaccharide heptosyltransferase II [Candidatus Omnitrophota bacterium]|nr:lipopolysaccharide heptosyltransferase II [Candidatus Omnitrophota bacterium]
MARKILFITLSNIGDCLLTLPVLDSLRQKFPEARITVIAGPRTKGVFAGNPDIHKFITYDKRASLKEKINLFVSLWKESFDVVVDLRNSLFGVFLPAKYKTSPFLKIPKRVKHMKDRHLYKIKGIFKIKDAPILPVALYPSLTDKEKINQILKENKINSEDKLIVVAAGARSHTKRWPRERFIELIAKLIQELPVKIILVGDREDREGNQYIAQQVRVPLVDLSARTSLNELSYLLKKASLLISNDSATLHLAGYLNIPVVAVFGITDDAKYGPWSEGSLVAKKEISCRPCQEAQCEFGTLECITLVKVEDVFRLVKDILLSEDRRQKAEDRKEFKRILVVRTDRIGDVLLSTPVIKALRDSYPHAFIAMMVSPYAKDIVEGNPYLDKVIILDKDGEHKNWLRSVKLIRKLKKMKFDLALVLHPTNRAHLLTFLSAIPKRVGYDRKLGFLLSDRIKHTKQFGEKHELDYNLDLLRYLGVEIKDKNLFIPVKPEAEKWVEELFRQEGISSSDKLLALNPSASCPSKIWPAERFAQTADKLTQKYGFKIIVISGPKDIRLADNLVKNMRSRAINLAAKTSVTQLASLLKRCSLFISNDSGPVHIASAVGTPVISIFGRNQAGLGPKRWGPVGERDKLLHKAACIECLAHNCQKQFTCLKAISVEDVVLAADAILQN